MRYKNHIIFVTMFSVMIGNAYAEEPIYVTQSPDMDKIIFDGKWTFLSEWKRSSLSTIYHDGKQDYLRTAHMGDSIYVFVDSLSDTTANKGADRATVCIDANHTKSKTPQSNDYCFVSTLNGNAFVLQGGSDLAATGYFTKIPSPEGFIGVGAMSDGNDRYSTVPHAGYEFKIPASLVGRSSSYGFYVSVYDAQTSRYYSWPANETGNGISSPSLWGDFVSPDESLPEFSLPVITMIPAIFLVVYLTRSFRMI